MADPKIKIFDLNNPQHKTAADIFRTAADLPLICPHSHVDPWLLADPDRRFKDPAALFVIPDHYVLRMLVSQGVSFEELGIFPLDERNRGYDALAVWRVFCNNFHLFDGTPTGLWIENALSMVFGIHQKPNAQNAETLFSMIQNIIEGEGFLPRKLYDRFNIEALCTTDAAIDDLQAHRHIRNSGWKGRVLPTFRPDAVINVRQTGWLAKIAELSRVCDMDINNYPAYIRALENRRMYFKSMGAVATDHAAETPFTCRLTAEKAADLFEKALTKTISADEEKLFIGHMMFEMARMSVEDGLIMQFHVGAYRNHNAAVLKTYGVDLGFDIPLKVTWTRNLKPLLDAFGMDPSFRLILFTLDESSYSRELAPIAGAYPAVKLGPPWWFNDSPNGMRRYFDSVMETAGIENTVGFNDDTRAFLSIPARHDLWRRMAALWLARLVHQGQIDTKTANERMADLAYRLAKQAYRI